MSYASNQYRRAAGAVLSPREAEAAAFVFVNRLLEGDDGDAARMRALGKNHELWSMLLKDLAADSNALPPVLKSDLVTVGLWSMRYSVAAMADERPLVPLLDINNDMIAALRQAALPPVPVEVGRLALAG